MMAIPTTIRRAAIVLATTALAAATFADATANILALGRPDAALRLAPSKVKALNALGDERLAADADTAIDSVTAIARKSLGRQLVNPVALRLVGLTRGARNDQAGANRDIALAERLSRRDLGTQLWLIETAVSRDDLAGALRHYDRALRGSEGSAALLFPVLTQAAATPEVRAALAPYVRAQAPWVAQFVAHAASELRFSDAALVVLAAGRVPDSPAYLTVTQTLLPSVAETGDYALARRYYLATPHADPALLRATGFDNRTIDASLAPMTWQTSKTAGVFAEFSDDGSTRRMVAAAEDNVSGWAARKLLYLPIGRYGLSINYTLATPSDGAAAAVVVECVAKGAARQIANLPMVSGGTRASVDLVVGAECPTQMVRIDLRGGDGSRTDLTLSSLSISPR